MSRKKKYSWLAALLSATLFLCSCAKEDASSDSDSAEESSSSIISSSIISSSTDETVTSEEQEPDKEPEESLPRMDGSTSAIPLEIGLKSGFLGIPYTQAKEMVSHTTTHDSFKRLINGEVDLIFSVPISEEQQKAANDAGVKLFMEPVAREGFVFVVNANNPIDSLTSEQLRKIYSGEITNWSQVGGNNELILPYQRNLDSGSQNYMTVFMEDVPLMPPKTEYVAGGMGGLMDAIAVYDNSEGAIGYSVYSYAAQMYANANKVKFIAVDGVAPSKATMADESYPLLSCTYMIYTDRSPESAKEFVEKALSDEGQGYVLDSGYLPVNGMEVPEKYLPYKAVGTGEKRPADFKPSEKFSKAKLTVTKDNENFKAPVLNTGSTFKLDFLKDEELQSRINDDISEALKRLGADSKRAASDNELAGGIYFHSICRNGYLSIMIMKRLPLTNLYSGAETLNYDLFSGEKLERFCDLFYEGEDFVLDVNRRIAEFLNLQAADYYYDNVPKLDFSGILGEPRLFTINHVGLEPDNMYFTFGQFVQFFNEYDDIRECDCRCVAMQYRDMKELVREEWTELIGEYDYNEWETEYAAEDDDFYLRIVGSQFHTAEEVKAEDEFRYELQRRAWEHLRRSIPDYNSWGSIRYSKWENYYSVGNVSFDADSDRTVNFDADTLEIITMEMLVGENWQQYLVDEDKEFAELELYPSVWIDNDDETMMVFAYLDAHTEWGWRSARLEVPREEFNKRYLNV